MEEYSTEPVGTVDPEVRAHVTSLVSALGGSGGYDDGRYVLGDEALACLRDLKRWLKLYDEKTNRLDVARVLAERNLVKGDLLEILASWPDEDTEDKLKLRVALACLELLVPLTWPIEKEELNPTANHYRNAPYLQLAQISYKREIFEHPSSSILRTAARTALGSFSIPMGDRTQRDEGIIKLFLYFIRNIVMISAPAALPVEWNENEVSRSATIKALHEQEIFPLLLTILSGIGEDFNTQDVVLLEILFHLLKGVNVYKLFLDDEELQAKQATELQTLICKEETMIRGHSKDAPTRHNRFGTMIWVQRDEERVSAVSGQDVLTSDQHTMEKMDHSKKWNRPKRMLRDETNSKTFGLPIPLTPLATKRLRFFIEEFLDSGFNPLFSHLRRAIEREADRVTEAHSYQFFYLTAWFLEAERVRREGKKILSSNRDQSGALVETDSFGIVASVLNQETFVSLSRFMQAKFDHKEWSELNAGMRAFTQILLIVQLMAESSLEEDQEIAENIQNRIFYEEATHDRVLAILRGYKDQDFSYLDACTELAHVFLRMLERYSKENVDLQVRSRRRARKKTKEVHHPKEIEDIENPDDSEAEELADAQRISRERKFDFNRFGARFVSQSCINTFTSLLSFYKILNEDQLKRAHRFFHRVAFKQEMSVLLFRLDIIALLSRLIDSPDGLERSNIMYSEWEQLIKQIFRRLINKMEEEDVMSVELLFSKISSTTYYLEYGYDRQPQSANPRAPAELEIVGEHSFRDQLAIVIVNILEDGKPHASSVFWVETVLRSAADERLSWETEKGARALNDAVGDQVQEAEINQPQAGGAGQIQEAGIDQPQESTMQPPSITVKPDNDERRVQMHKYDKLRLLMTLAGFQRNGEERDTNAAWVVPSCISYGKLQETATLIQGLCQDAPKLYGEDGAPAAELLRRKAEKTDDQSPPLATFDEDSDGADSLDEDDLLYRASGPTARKPTALEQLKKKRRKRQRLDDDEDQNSGEEAPRAKQKAKLLLAKSKEFIYDSDEDVDSEEDRQFFAQEETRRSEQVSKIIQALRTQVDKPATNNKRKSMDTTEKSSKKRKAGGEEDGISHATDTGDSLDERVASAEDSPPHLAHSSPSPGEKDVGFSDAEESDTPPSSEIGDKEGLDAAKRGIRLERAMDAKKPSTGIEMSDHVGREEAVQLKILGDAGEDYEDDDVDIQPVMRRRLNMAILNDSDDE